MPDRDPECVFCGIVAGEIPSTKLYEDEEILAFEDIHPVAPVHLLVIPKRHIPTADDVRDEEGDLLGRMFLTARSLARSAGIVEDGYRIVMNVNRGAGQLVFHIHFHVLGGRPLGKMG